MEKLFNNKWVCGGFLFLAFILMSIRCEPIPDARADSAGLGTYSEGYRMGQITKFSVKGLMTKSGEGQMLMGREGTPYIIYGKDSDGNTTKRVINPWYFSAEISQADKINEFSGEYAWIRYEQAQIRNFISYDTDYMVKEIDKPTKEEPVECIDRKADGSKSEGFRVGRIVKASKKGHLSDSYEIIIQVGNSGNQFKHMSIISPDMFQCAVDTLKSGKKVKIEYSQSFFHNPLGQDSSYNVKSIAPLSDI